MTFPQQQNAPATHGWAAEAPAPSSLPDASATKQRSTMKKGDIRFTVHYSPSEMFDAVDAAVEGALVRIFLSFDTAARFAIWVVEADFFGSVSVYREVCASEKYGWWDEDGTWCVESETALTDLNPDEPHIKRGLE